MSSLKCFDAHSFSDRKDIMCTESRILKFLDSQDSYLLKTKLLCHCLLRNLFHLSSYLRSRTGME